MEIRKVGVLGCGLMGAGIAQVSATAGFETVVKEVSDEFITKGFGGIEKSLARFAEKGTITGDQQREIRGRLSGTTSFAELADCDGGSHRQSAPARGLLTKQTHSRLVRSSSQEWAPPGAHSN